ncbi:unnamed protein product [Cochlearia groenlandica]
MISSSSSLGKIVGPTNMWRPSIAFYEAPRRVVWTPPSGSCGTSPAALFSSKYWTRPRPCRRARPPGSRIPVSQSP